MLNGKRVPVLMAIAAAAYLAHAGSDAHALWLGDKLKSAASFVSGAASSAASFVGNTASSVASAASSVVNKTWEATKSAASTVAQTASNVATSVANTASNVATAVKNTAAAAVSTAKKVATNTWNTVSNAGKQAWSFAANGAKNLADKTKDAAKWVGDKVNQGLSWVKDQVNIIGKYGARVLEGVKNKVKSTLGPIFEKVWGWAKEKLQSAIEMAKSASPAFREVMAVVEGKQSIADAVGNLHAAHGAQLKQKVTEALTNAAMKVLDRPIRKVVAWAVDKILQLLQTPVAQAIATALSSAIASAVATITAGIGAFLQPVLQPLTKWTADRILDWARGLVKDKIANWIYERGQGAIRSYIVQPLIVRAYDGLVNLLKRKFPAVFGKVSRMVPAHAFGG